VANRSSDGSQPTHLLVESDDPYAAMSDAIAFIDAGFDVVICGGPATEETCPALDGLPCPLVGDADVVLNAVSDRETRGALADAVHASAPDVPVVVRVGSRADTDVPPGCHRLSADASAGARVAAVRRALAGPAADVRDGDE
jgi:hypothetical protein